MPSNYTFSPFLYVRSILNKIKKFYIKSSSCLLIYLHCPLCVKNRFCNKNKKNMVKFKNRKRKTSRSKVESMINNDLKLDEAVKKSNCSKSTLLRECKIIYGKYSWPNDIKRKYIKRVNLLPIKSEIMKFIDKKLNLNQIQRIYGFKKDKVIEATKKILNKEYPYKRSTRVFVSNLTDEEICNINEKYYDIHNNDINKSFSNIALNMGYNLYTLRRILCIAYSIEKKNVN